MAANQQQQTGLLWQHQGKKKPVLQARGWGFVAADKNSSHVTYTFTDNVLHIAVRAGENGRLRHQGQLQCDWQVAKAHAAAFDASLAAYARRRHPQAKNLNGFADSESFVLAISMADAATMDVLSSRLAAPEDNIFLAGVGHLLERICLVQHGVARQEFLHLSGNWQQQEPQDYVLTTLSPNLLLICLPPTADGEVGGGVQLCRHTEKGRQILFNGQRSLEDLGLLYQTILTLPETQRALQPAHLQLLRRQEDILADLRTIAENALAAPVQQAAPAAAPLRVLA